MKNYLIVADEISQLKTFKKPVMQKLGRLYIRHLSKRVAGVIQKLPKDANVHIIGPSEALDQIETNERLHVYFYHDLINDIDYKWAGREASRMADDLIQASSRADKSGVLTKTGFSLSRSIFTQLAFLFCFDPLLHHDVFKKFLPKHKIDEVVLIDSVTEVSRIAKAFFESHQIKVQTSSSFSLPAWLKEKVITQLYFRDRHARIHTLTHAKDAKGISATKIDRSKKLIILAPAHLLQLKMVIPLAKEIQNKMDAEPLLLVTRRMRESYPGFSELSLSWCEIESFESEEILQSIAKHNHDPLNDITENICQSDEVHKKLTVDQTDWLETLGDKIKIFISQTFTESIVLDHLICKCLKELKPAGVFVFSDNRIFESAIARRATFENIPTFLFSPNPVMSLDETNRYDTAKTVMLEGDFIKRKVLAKGFVKENQIHTVGSMRFTSLAEMSQSFDRKTLCKEINISENDQLILLVSSYVNLRHTTDEKVQMFKAAAKAVSHVPNGKLIVKAHPNENKEALIQLFNSLGLSNAILLDREISIIPLLFASRMLITYWSLSSLEAMMVGTPVILSNLWHRDFVHFPLAEGGGALVVTNEEEMVNAVEKLAKDDNFYREQVEKGKKFVSTMIKQPPGQASEEIIRIVKENLKNSKNEHENSEIYSHESKN